MKDRKYVFIVIFFIIGVLLILIISSAFSVFSNIKDSSLTQVIINDNIIYVEIPKTPAERLKGLGERDFLAENQGMLFVFEQKQKPGFVMRKMKFPLDFIWINDNQIVEITSNAPIPDSDHELQVYYPQSEVNYVLEVNAGYSDQHNIKIGDKVDIFTDFN
ncbi:MAG: hypothetical protein GF365_02425 [Candidatus Buchananbacteria bacterium]|nr:hypothetical protein [Candidatus Buchananbacteria bacterium]